MQTTLVYHPSLGKMFCLGCLKWSDTVKISCSDHSFPWQIFTNQVSFPQPYTKACKSERSSSLHIKLNIYGKGERYEET